MKHRNETGGEKKGKEMKLKLLQSFHFGLVQGRVSQNLFENCLFFFLAAPPGMWNLSSPTRD